MQGPENHGANSDPTLLHLAEIISTLGGSSIAPGQQQSFGSEAVAAAAEIAPRANLAAMLAEDHAAILNDIDPQRPDGEVIKAAQRATVALIRAAAAVGDMAAVDKHIERLAAQRQQYGKAAEGAINGYLVAAVVGSEQAEQLLRAELSAEEYQFKKSRPDSRWMSPYTSPILKRVVEACVESDMPADAWIDEYAGIGMRRWAAYANYLVHAYENPAFTTEQRRAIEQMVASFMTTDMPYRHINELVPSLLNYTDDPDARREMVNRYIISLGYSNIDESWALGLEKVYGLIVLEPDLSDDAEALGHIPTILAAADSEMDRPTEGRWKIDQLVADGVPPQEVIERLDLFIGEEVATGDRRSISFKRDMWLGDYAASYARRGDFETARTLLGAISTTAEYNRAAGNCLKYCNDGQGPAGLQPNEMELMVSPARGIPYMIYEAQQNNDPQVIADVLVSLAADTAEPREPRAKDAIASWIPSIMGGPVAEVAYETLLDSSSEYYRDATIKRAFYDAKDKHPAHALALAQRLLVTLRQGSPDRNKPLIWHFSDEAVRLGDKEELRIQQEALALLEPGAGRAREIALLLRNAPR